MTHRVAPFRKLSINEQQKTVIFVRAFARSKLSIAQLSAAGNLSMAHIDEIH